MKHLLVGQHLVGYTDVGSGTPVIVVHGSASSREQWNPLAKRLADRYRVLAVDLLGYGSTRPLRANRRYQIGDDVDIVTAFAALMNEPVHLVGHAYGGMVCLEAALALEPQVLSMSLFEPAAVHLLRDAPHQAAWNEIAQLAERHIELTWQGDHSGSAEMFMNYLEGPEFWAHLPNNRRAQIARYMPRVASEWLLALETHWERDRYAHVKVPTLLMRGTRTPNAAKQMVDALSATVPQAEVIDVDGAAHLGPITHSYAVNELIDSHLWRNTHVFGGAC